MSLGKLLESKKQLEFSTFFRIVRPSTEANEKKRLIYKICDLNKDSKLCRQDMKYVLNTIKSYLVKSNKVNEISNIDIKDFIKKYTNRSGVIRSSEFSKWIEESTWFYHFFDRFFCSEIFEFIKSPVVIDGFFYEIHDTQYTVELIAAFCENFFIILSNELLKSIYLLNNCSVIYSYISERGHYEFCFIYGLEQLPKRKYVTKSFSLIETLQKATNSFDVKEKYLFVKNVGRGKFANVRKIKDTKTRENYALKKIPLRKISMKTIWTIYSEKQVYELSSHDNIVQLKEFIKGPKSYNFILEYSKYGDLWRCIESNETLEEEKIRKIMIQLIRALKYLHSLGIVHRDIKPENILFVDKDKFDIKIFDFGLSTFSQKSEKLKDVCGSIFYMPPEMLNYSGYGFKADLWSAGVIMYYL